MWYKLETSKALRVTVGTVVQPRVFEEVKKIVEMIDERADASAKWTSYALLFDVRICSMYVTGLPSQDGRIAPN